MRLLLRGIILLGPTGIGGLVLAALDVRTTRFGGTERDSRSLIHSQTYPDRLEVGTINIAGVFGLLAGLRYLAERGMEDIHAREMDLAKRLFNGLSSIKGVRVYPSTRRDPSVPILLCNVEGMDPENVSPSGRRFRNRHPGRSPLRAARPPGLGTSPKGGVRFSLGPFNTAEEIDKACEAMATISRK